MTLYVLAGPTAVGKTQLAIDWALANNAEILACDSTTFYKGMDLGAAKPTLEEQKLVKHYGIDIADVSKQYNVYDFINYSKEVIHSIESRNKQLLIVGGSGFYLKSFFSAVVDDIVVSDEIKLNVERLYDELGLEGLVVSLLKLNPNGIGGLDLKNPRRVMKALMRCMASGLSYLELKEQFDTKKSDFFDYKKKLTLLSRNDEDLKLRIRLRAESMLNLGLIAEVEALLKKGLKNNPSAASAIGYREVINFLENSEKDEEKLLEEIITNTNRLVAKQRKWFRHQVSPDKIINLSEKKIIELGQLF